ncbi:MAG: hypothetical protein ACP5O1_04655 [Phycisphaerae bacterium]
MIFKVVASIVPPAACAAADTPARSARPTGPCVDYRRKSPIAPRRKLPTGGHHRFLPPGLAALAEAWMPVIH